MPSPLTSVMSVNPVDTERGKLNGLIPSPAAKVLPFQLEATESLGKSWIPMPPNKFGLFHKPCTRKIGLLFRFN